MTLNIRFNNGTSRTIENVAYFSIYPNIEELNPEVFIRIECKDTLESEYIDLKDVRNIWHREPK